MSISSQLWFLRRKDSYTRRIIVPAIAACGMTCTSFLPWLQDPLGQVYTAWNIPVHLGWQIPVNITSYGLLCGLSAVYAALVSYASWREFKGRTYFLYRYVNAAFLCSLPLIFLLVQYLSADVQRIDLLVQHKVQAQLIGEHFDYNAANDLISIKPFLLNTSILYQRVILLLDQIRPGAIVPLLFAWMLLDYRRIMAASSMPELVPTRTRKRGRFWTLLVATGILIVLLRPLVGSFCEYEAKTLLTSGEYVQALVWLDSARSFNPGLEQVAYYHLERGEALYYLHPDIHTDETRIYLASAYRTQNDYLDAYSELLGSWRLGQTPSWVVSEMATTLEGLSEYTHPLRGPLILRPAHDDTALPWVQVLTQVDPSNTFAHYLVGRIDYDLHSYTQCQVQMSVVAQQSSDANIQSSALTYIGLSAIGLGNDAQGREYLFKAVALDSDYRNNTAREELSGLR